MYLPNPKSIEVFPVLFHLVAPREKPAGKQETTEPPPCVIYPKGGKENARSKPGKRKGKDKVSQPNLGFGSRLCEGKVLAPFVSMVIHGLLITGSLIFLSEKCR